MENSEHPMENPVVQAVRGIARARSDRDEEHLIKLQLLIWQQQNQIDDLEKTIKNLNKIIENFQQPQGKND